MRIALQSKDASRSSKAIDSRNITGNLDETAKQILNPLKHPNSNVQPKHARHRPKIHNPTTRKQEFLDILPYRSQRREPTMLQIHKAGDVNMSTDELRSTQNLRASINNSKESVEDPRKLKIRKNYTAPTLQYQLGTTSILQNHTVPIQQRNKTSFQQDVAVVFKQNDTSIHEHGTISIQQNNTTPVHQRGAKSAQQTDKTSVHQHDTTSVNQHGATSAQQNDTTSVHQHDTTSVHQHGATSAQQNDTTSVHQHDTTSVHQYGATSAQQNNTTSVHQHDTTSVHQHGATSSQQNDSTSIHEHGTTSRKQLNATSVHQHGTKSVEQKDRSSIHQHGTISSQRNDKTTTHQHGRTSIKQNDTTSTYQHSTTSSQKNDAASTHQHGRASSQQNDTASVHQHGTTSVQQNDTKSIDEHGTASVLQNNEKSIYQQGTTSIKQNDTTATHLHDTTSSQKNDIRSIYQHDSTSMKQNDTKSIDQHGTTPFQKHYSKSMYQHGTTSIHQHGATSTQQNSTISVHHENTTSIQQNDVKSIHQKDTASIRKDGTISIQQRNLTSFQQNYTTSIQHYAKTLTKQNDTTIIQQGNASDNGTINREKAFQNSKVASHKPKTEKEAFKSVNMPIIYPEMDKIDTQRKTRQRNITKFSSLSAKNKSAPAHQDSSKMQDRDGKLTINDTHLIKDHEKNSQVNSSKHSKLFVPHKTVTEVYKYTTIDMNKTDLPARDYSAFKNTTEYVKQISRRPVGSSILNATSQNRFANHRFTVENIKAIDEVAREEQNGTQVNNATRDNETGISAAVSLSYQNLTISSNTSKNASSLVMYPRPAVAMPSTKHIPNRAEIREQNFGHRTANGSVIFLSSKETKVSAVHSSHRLPVSIPIFPPSNHTTLNKSSKYVPETEAVTTWHSLHSNTKSPINKAMSQNSSANGNRNFESVGNNNFSHSNGSINQFHQYISYPSPTGRHKYNATSKTMPNHLVGHKTTSTKPTYTAQHKSRVKNNTKQKVSNFFESVHATSTRNTSSTSGMKLSPVIRGNFTSKYTQTPYWLNEYFPWKNYKHPIPKSTVSPLKSINSTPYEFSYKRLFWKTVPGQSPFWLQYQNLARNLTGKLLPTSNQKSTVAFNGYRSTAENSSGLSNETIGKEEKVPINNLSKKTKNLHMNNSKVFNNTTLKVKNETHNSSLYDASHDSKHLHGDKTLKMSNSSAIPSNPLINKTISKTVHIKNSTSSSGNSFSELDRTVALEQNHTHINDKVVNKRPKILNDGTDNSKLNYTAHGSSHLLFTSSRTKTDNGSKRVFSNGLFSNASTERFFNHKMLTSSVRKVPSGLVTKLNKTEQFLNTVRKKQNPDVTLRVHYRLRKPSHVKHKRPTSNQKAGNHKSQTTGTQKNQTTWTQKNQTTWTQKNQTTGIQKNQATGIQKSRASDVIRVYYHLNNHRGKMHTEKKPKEKLAGRTSKTPDTIRVYYNPGRFMHPKKKVNDSIRLGVSKKKSANLTEFYGIKKIYMQDSLEDKELGMHPIAPTNKSNTAQELNDLSLKETTLKVKETDNTPSTVKLPHLSKNAESKESSSISTQVSNSQMKSPYKFMIYVPQDSVSPRLPQNSNYFSQKPKGAKTSTGDRKSVPRTDSNRDISVSPKHSFHRKRADGKHCNLLGIYVDRVLQDGAEAGNFYPVLFVKDPVHCHRKCCADQRCNFAMFYRDFCYLIECFSKLSCRLVHSKAVTRHPHLLAKIREPEDRSLSRVYKFPPEMGLAHVPSMFIRPKSAETVRGKSRSSKSQKEALMDLFHLLLTQLEGRHPTSKREHVTVIPHLEQKVKNSNTISPVVIHNSTRLLKTATNQSAMRNKQLPLFAKPFFGMPLNRTSATNQNFPNNDDTYLSDYLNQTFASVSKPFHPTIPSKMKLSTTHSRSKHPTLHSALSAVSPLEVKKIVADLATQLSQMNLKLKDVLPELRYVLLHSRSRLHSSNNVSRTIFDGIKELRAAELRGKVSSFSGHSIKPIVTSIFRPRQDLGPISGTKTDSPVNDSHPKKQELKSFQAAEQLMNSVKDRSRPKVNENSRLTCMITSVRGGATLFGGPRSGVFTSHGGGMSLDQCIERCCTAESCHVALLVSGHCYTVKCYTASLCGIVPAKRAGQYLMTVAYVRRRITYSTGEQGRIQTSIGDTTLPVSAVVCTESVVYEGYTLKGGYDAGHFTYKGEVGTLADCIELCCTANFCDLVFMVTSQCYLVYCYSKDGCQHVKAYHGVLFRTRIAYLHSRKNIIPPWVPRNIELRGAISTVKKDFKNGIINLNNGHPMTPMLKQLHHLNSTTATRTSPIKSPLITKNSFLQTCVLAKALAQTTMAEGHKAGKLLFRGRKTNDRDCIKDCCLNNKCNIALLVQDYCFNVICKSRRACKPVKAVKSKHSVRLAVIRTSVAHVNGMFTLAPTLSF